MHSQVRNLVRLFFLKDCRCERFISPPNSVVEVAAEKQFGGETISSELFTIELLRRIRIIRECTLGQSGSYLIGIYLQTTVGRGTLAANFDVSHGISKFRDAGLAPGGVRAAMRWSLLCGPLVLLTERPLATTATGETFATAFAKFTSVPIFCISNHICVSSTLTS